MIGRELRFTMADGQPAAPPDGDAAMELRLQKVITAMTTWRNDEEEYYTGIRVPDCTTMAIAARYGRLHFLNWAAAYGYGHEFDDTTLGYARDGYKGAPEDKAETISLIERVLAIHKEYPWLPLACTKCQSKIFNYFSPTNMADTVKGVLYACDRCRDTKAIVVNDPRSTQFRDPGQIMLSDLLINKLKV